MVRAGSKTKTSEWYALEHAAGEGDHLRTAASVITDTDCRRTRPRCLGREGDTNRAARPRRQ